MTEKPYRAGHVAGRHAQAAQRSVRGDGGVGAGQVRSERLLDDGDGDEDASNALVLGYPTAAMTLYDLTGDWADLDEQGATIRAHHVPRA